MEITRRYGFYWALLGLALLINAAGYGLTLWHDETVFDEVVHAFTSFACVAAIGRILVGRRAVQPSGKLMLLLLFLGICLGVVWEVFEWLIGIIGNRHDTLIDLAMDVIGTLVAALLINRAFSSRPSKAIKPGSARPSTRRSST